jgi:hypothetical protein
MVSFLVFDASSESAGTGSSAPAPGVISPVAARSIHVFSMVYENQRSTPTTLCAMGSIHLLASLRITKKHCMMISERRLWIMSPVHFKGMELGTCKVRSKCYQL